MRENRFRNKLRSNDPMFGMAVYSGSPTFVEIIGHTGFDFIFLDTEHSPLSVGVQLEHIIRAADTVNLAVVVRLKGNDEHMVRNAFEAGVDCVCIPHIRTREDIEKAIRYAKFPPRGIRGAACDVRTAQYAAAPDFDWAAFVEKSNKETVVMGIAEDGEFFDNIDEILSVEGLDMISFGPTDLASSLGLPLLYAFDSPPIRERYELLVRKAKEYGVALVCPASPSTLENAKKFIDAGVKAVIMRNDLSNFGNVCKQLVSQVAAPLRAEKRTGDLRFGK